MDSKYGSFALLGDEICPVMAAGADGKLYTVSLNGADGSPYCVVEFTSPAQPDIRMAGKPCLHELDGHANV